MKEKEIYLAGGCYRSVSKAETYTLDLFTADPQIMIGNSYKNFA